MPEKRSLCPDYSLSRAPAVIAMRDRRHFASTGAETAPRWPVARGSRPHRAARPVSLRLNRLRRHRPAPVSGLPPVTPSPALRPDRYARSASPTVYGLPPVTPLPALRPDRYARSASPTVHDLPPVTPSPRSRPDRHARPASVRLTRLRRNRPSTVYGLPTVTPSPALPP